MDSRIIWQPPRSPIGMMQEDMWPDTWRILVTCILHNQTRRKQVDGVYERMYERYPTPEAMAAAEQTELAEIIQSLGFQNRRSAALIRFSREFLEKEWNSPKELYACGKYAEDCYRVFCLGDWVDVRPTDHKLNDYVDWLREQHGMEKLYA